MSATRIFLWIVLAFLGGVFARSFFEIPASITWFLVFVSACFAVYGFSRARLNIALIGFFLLAFAVGIFRFSAAMQIPDSVALRYDARSELSGFVWREPERKGQAQELIINIMEDENGPLTEPFFVLARTRAYPVYQTGEFLSLIGRIEKPSSEGSFDYAAYLAKDTIYALMQYPAITVSPLAGSLPAGLRVKKALFEIKRVFVEKMESIIPEPQAAFLAGLLVGERRDMTPDMIVSLQKTGTMHLVALSGFNVSIIADNFLWVLQRLLIPFVISFWVAIFFVIAFTVMTGASASLVRAAIMGILVLVARKSGRMYEARAALLAAAGIMVLHEPGILRFDLGFQLSFLATLGIMTISPRLHALFERKAGSGIASVAATTLGAQLAVIPLLFYTFGSVSLISPVANFLVLAIIPITMLLGFCAVCFGFLSAALGTIVGLSAWIFLSYEIGIIKFWGNIPFASIETSFIGSLLIAFLYGWLMKIIFKSTART